MALAADWLTSAWDQNVGLYVASPTVAVLEDTAGRWLNGLFGLPLVPVKLKRMLEPPPGVYRRIAPTPFAPPEGESA